MISGDEDARVCTDLPDSACRVVPDPGGSTDDPLASHSVAHSPAMHFSERR